MIGSRLFLHFIIIVVFFSSCSQHVKISPRRCVAPKARWSIPTDTETFRFKHQIRTDGEYTLVRRVFDRKNKDCEDLDNISLTHKYTWGDVLWNLIPLTGRSTLIVNGSSSAPRSTNSEDEQ